MLDWLKRKELLTIKDQSDTIAFLEGKIQELIQIANAKKVLVCTNDKCMDWDKIKKGCCLEKIIITPSGRCEDAYDPKDMIEDFSVTKKAPTGFIINDSN
jgi:hypothetical protein